MLGGLIKNEFIKLFSKKKTYIILGLFIILMIGFFFVSKSSEEWFLKSNSLEYQIESYENEIEWIQNDIKEIKSNNDLSGFEKSNELKMKEEMILNIKEEIKSSKEQDLKTKNLSNKEKIKYEIKNLESFKNKSESSEEKHNLSKQIEKLNVYLEHDIPLDTLNMSNSITYLILSITAVAVGFLAFGILIFNSDIVSGEYNPGTLKFLLIQPVTRTKVLLSKFIVAIISSISLIIGIQILSSLIVGLINGFGNLNTPFLANQEFEYIFNEGEKVLSSISGSGEFISMSSFLIKSFVLESLFIIAMISFIFFISVIAQSTVISITIIIATILGSNIIYSLSATYRKISPFIFIHLTNPENIISRNIVLETEFINAGFSSSIIVLIATSIIFVSASLYIFKKKDILI